MSDNEIKFQFGRFFAKNYEAILRRKNFLQNRVNNATGKVLSFDMSEKRALIYMLSVLDKAREMMGSESLSKEEKQVIQKLFIINENNDDAYNRIKKRLEDKNSVE